MSKIDQVTDLNWLELKPARGNNHNKKSFIGLNHAATPEPKIIYTSLILRTKITKF